MNEVPKLSGLDLFVCLNWNEAQLYNLWGFLGIVVLSLPIDVWTARRKGKDCLHY